MVKIAINGFGRIGRLAFRAILLNYPQIEITAVNTSGSMELSGWAHLLKYDSVYGGFSKEIKIESTKNKGKEIGKIIIEGKVYPFLSIREPEKIPWKKYEAEVVLESTGVFRRKQEVSKHFKAGAKKVIISAPPKDNKIPIYILGVNEKKYQGENLISNGSCTTNCAAPVAKIILENFGIKKIAMTTIHGYTASQRLVDGSHKDLRRARAAAINIVPTTTGAAKAVIAVIPQLKGKFCASAIRAPISCGSYSDFTFLTKEKVTKEKVNALFSKKAKEEYKGIVNAEKDPLVSSDIIGNPNSAVVDLLQTEVIKGNLLKVFAWYDNEWAYALRLVELSSYISNFK